MDTQMRFEVEIQGKFLVADLALVGLFSSVHKHMTLKLGVV